MAYEGDTFCVRPSNDINQDTLVDLTTLGVVDLNTSLMPYVVFSLEWDCTGLH